MQTKILCEWKVLFVHHPERIAECIYKLKENKLEPKKCFFLIQVSSPSCAFFECVKKGKEENLKVLPPLNNT